MDVPTTTRSSQGLKEVLFQQIDALRTGGGDVAVAREIGKLSHQVNASVKNDLEMARFLTKTFPGKFDDRIRSVLELPAA